MKPIGLVIAEVDAGTNRTAAKRLAKLAAESVPDGRILAVIYPMPQSWKISLPYESDITSAILGNPKERGGEPEWEFFGNLAVRLCNVIPSVREVEREVGVLLLRRAGEKTYVRRLGAFSETLESSRLPVLDPVFTRDVANNIWHLRVKNSETALRRRLGALLSWSDETILVFNQQGLRRYPNHRLRLESDLVGVPVKVSYVWHRPLGNGPRDAEQGELFTK